MKRSHFCAALVSVASFAADPVRACEFCGLPTHAKHRTGSHTVVLRTSRSHFRRWTDARIEIAIVNDGAIPMRIDTSTPIWKQSSLHVEGPRSGESFGDVALGSRPTFALAPGATYRFRDADGNASIPISKWSGNEQRIFGVYALDITYGKVDSATIYFRLG